MQPSARKSTRSAIAAAPASCVTMTVVCPYDETDSRRSSRISALVVESRLPVGSSAKITVGFEMSALAMATRCCCPPESSDGRWLRRSARPTLPITSSIQALSSLLPASSSGSTMFSSAVSIGRRLKNWKMNPMCSRRSLVRSLSPRLAMFVPSIQTSPEVGWSSPARMCMRVDLPEPDGPMTAVSSPRLTSIEQPRRASTAVSPSP